LLVCRITLGWLFVVSGWLKLHDLAGLTRFFTDLRIPLPAESARLVAWSELLCGALVLVGLLSRLASLPLMITMVVALVTAKRDEIHGLSDLFFQVEFTYVCMLLVIVVLGPGAASVDAAVGRILRNGRTARREHAEPVVVA
jgi:putative oxidoreductase